MNRNFYDLDPVVLLKNYFSRWKRFLIVLFVAVTPQNSVYHKTCDLKINKMIKQSIFLAMCCLRRGSFGVYPSDVWHVARFTSAILPRWVTAIAFWLVFGSCTVWTYVGALAVLNEVSYGFSHYAVKKKVLTMWRSWLYVRLCDSV
jgi:hypothetical protein